MKKINVYNILILLLFIGFSSYAQDNKKVGPIKVEGIDLVEGYGEINTFEELTQRFKGKTLYVDIWATWCAPCRNEFRYKEDLEKFIGDQEIEIIYIATDRPRFKQNWLQFIKENKITGNHVLANEQLMADLKEQFHQDEKRGEKYILLPTFVIVNKNGEIMERDAKRPSQKKKLYRQLKKAIGES